MTEDTDKTAEKVDEKEAPAKSASDTPATSAEGAQPTSDKPEPAASAAAPVEQAQAGSSPSEDKAKQPQVGLAKERNLFNAVMATMKHIDDCERDRRAVFRHSDQTSLACLLFAFVSEVVLAALYVTQPSLRNLCLILAAVADILFGVAIFWYVIQRFGILRSFDSRVTLLTWQLMIGSGALFAFYTMNISFAFFIYYNVVILGTPVSPPQ